MHRTRVSVAVGLATALIGLAIPAVAVAHAELRTTVPDAGERLASGPGEVVLVFEGELDADGSRFTVAAADDEVVGEGGVDLTVAERNEMRGAVSAADPGSYTVEWQSRSIDGHEERGEFTFSVGATPPNTAMARPELGASPTTAQALLLLIAIGLVVRAALRRSRR